MCGCKKRQQAVGTAVRAIARGDMATVRQQGQVIRSSFADDRTALRNGLAAAKAILSR